MSDLSWLRGFQRSHTRAPIPTSDEGDHQPAGAATSSTSPEKAHQQQTQTSPTRLHHRVRPAAAVQRVSSLLNLNLSGGRETRSASFSGPIVETLQTVIMGRKDPLDPIPVMYNSSVLRLIEAYGNLSQRLQAMEQELSDLKTLRARELEQFREVSEDWMERETGYKAEIKRLEVVLAKESKDGVASVALARHGSLVDRSATKRFQARLKRLSNSQDGSNDEVATSKTAQKLDHSGGTACYKTIGAMPRALDSNLDVSISRLVEARERDERRWAREHRQRATRATTRSDFHEVRQPLKYTEEDYGLQRRLPGAVENHNNPDTAGQEIGIEKRTIKRATNSPPQHLEYIALAQGSGLHRDETFSVPGGFVTSPVRHAHQQNSSVPVILSQGANDDGLNRSNASNAVEHESTSTTRALPCSAAQRIDRGTSKPHYPLSKSGDVIDVFFATDSQAEVADGASRPPAGKQQRGRVYSFVEGQDEVLPVTSPVPSPGLRSRTRTPASGSPSHTDDSPGLWENLEFDTGSDIKEVSRQNSDTESDVSSTGNHDLTNGMRGRNGDLNRTAKYLCPSSAVKHTRDRADGDDAPDTGSPLLSSGRFNGKQSSNEDGPCSPSMGSPRPSGTPKAKDNKISSTRSGPATPRAPPAKRGAASRLTVLEPFSLRLWKTFGDHIRHGKITAEMSTGAGFRSCV
ncbi:hypothetical protein B0T19DRAFT_460861 [Cercophora scortea]|uniref:Uncharacterized protein n=1 Tax=Cercophora scortea TaxID=314031 RepID=A0AAE0IMI8_9PEZI|nr:hypothetical protein B0T19DRAFT_460861 [Cercophora scortea]